MIDSYSNEHKLMKSVLDTIAKYGGFDSDDAMMRSITREQGSGAIEARFHDLLGGYNRAQQGIAVPSNTDMQGLTFFTRPNLNLSYDNIMAYRQLSVLGSTDPYSYNRIIRRMLWPDSRIPVQRGSGFDTDLANDNAIFDNRQAFMPILSNALVNMSGWPDLTLHAQSSNEGIAKEQWMMNDSIAEVNGRFDLDCTFENMLGDPISLTLFSWLLYIGGVYLGTKIQPAGYSIMQNEIDYQTRIYRFVMDWSGRYIQKWANCGAAFPVGLSIGTSFNYSRDTPYNENNKQIQASFACTIAEYNDPITLWEFNKLVVMFNPDMGEDVRYTRMIRVDPGAASDKTAMEYITKLGIDPKEFEKMATVRKFNFKGFPFIDLKHYNELQWWVYPDDFVKIARGSMAKAVDGNQTVARESITSDVSDIDAVGFGNTDIIV
jgi:hypothetical protein